MSVLVVGTTALDSIKTPKSENPRLLGGSASHAAVASSFFARTRLMGVVGGDFPTKYVRLFEKHGICLKGLERVKEIPGILKTWERVFTEVAMVEKHGSVWVWKIPKRYTG